MKTNNDVKTIKMKSCQEKKEIKTTKYMKAD